MSSTSPPPPPPPVSSSSSLPPARDYSQLDLDDWKKPEILAWANSVFKGFDELLQTLIPIIQNGDFDPLMIELGEKKENEAKLTNAGIIKSAYQARIISACEKLLRSQQSRHSTPPRSSKPPDSQTSTVVASTHYSPVKPAPDDVCIFWRALQSLEWKESDDFITLPSGVYWGNNDLIGDSPLFIRDCYRRLFDSIHSQQSHRRLAILLGNPGIGKSFFLYFVLAKLAKVRDSLIIYHNSELALLYSSRGVQQGTISQLFSIVEKQIKNVYYLVDGIVPNINVRISAGTVILATSPNKQIYKEFEKQMTFQSPQYLPIWSWEEIALCRSVSFPSVPLQLARDLFNKFGGIPRFVLQKALSRKPLDALTRAIDQSNLGELIHSVGQMREMEGASHKLLHIIVDPDSNWETTHIEFSSVWVAEQVSNRFFVNQRDEFLTFLSVSRDSGDAAGLRGNLFEGFVHQLLRRGGSFWVRNLEIEGSEAEQFSFPESPNPSEIVFDSIESISELAANQYARPLSKSFAAIDSLVLPNLLVQSTVALEHPIKRNRLEKILSLLPPLGWPVRLFFAVPESSFAAFKKQKYLTEKNSVAANQVVGNVQQWVIRIPLSRKEVDIEQICIRASPAEAVEAEAEPAEEEIAAMEEESERETAKKRKIGN